MLGKIIQNLINQEINRRQFADIIWGEVTNKSPLKIKVSNRLEITEEHLVLTSLVKEVWINIPEDDDFEHIHKIPQHYTGPSSGAPGTPHTHVIDPLDTLKALPKIKLWRGLNAGDKVIMLKLSGGQKYLVLERVDGVRNDADS